jgi:hypothetical protein
VAFLAQKIQERLERRPHLAAARIIKKNPVAGVGAHSSSAVTSLPSARSDAMKTGGPCTSAKPSMAARRATGNNRLDTMSNILADAEVGLLFFIPGIDETLRINGTARLSREPELLAAAAINCREPRPIILVTVREAFLHCGKALKRSRLWQDDYRVDKRSFPSLGRMIVEQTKPATVTVPQADAFIAENYVTGLY